MAATYEPIATTTLGSAASSITFNSIASTWTDLRLVIIGTGTSGGGDLLIRFNSDSSSSYSDTSLRGNGTAAASSRNTNQTAIDVNATLGIFGTNISFITYDIFSYAGSTYKTSLITTSDDENGSGGLVRIVGLWRNTAAITRIDLTLNNATQFNTGTIATLYGIKSA